MRSRQALGSVRKWSKQCWPRTVISRIIIHSGENSPATCVCVSQSHARSKHIHFIWNTQQLDNPSWYKSSKYSSSGGRLYCAEGPPWQTTDRVPHIHKCAYYLDRKPLKKHHRCYFKSYFIIENVFLSKVTLFNQTRGEEHGVAPAVAVPGGPGGARPIRAAATAPTSTHRQAGFDGGWRNQGPSLGCTIQLTMVSTTCNIWSSLGPNHGHHFLKKK